MKLHVDIEKDLHSFRLEVSFDTDGEVFAVLGSSGSGKSMTLKCIAGIEKPDRGVVTLGGRVLLTRRPRSICRLKNGGSGICFRIMPCFPT